VVQIPQQANKTPINANYSVLESKQACCMALGFQFGSFNPPKKSNAEKLTTATAGGIAA
jgi:hypothetical protein